MHGLLLYCMLLLPCSGLCGAVFCLCYQHELTSALYFVIWTTEASNSESVGPDVPKRGCCARNLACSVSSFLTNPTWYVCWAGRRVLVCSSNTSPARRMGTSCRHRETLFEHGLHCGVVQLASARPVAPAAGADACTPQIAVMCRANEGDMGIYTAALCSCVYVPAQWQCDRNWLWGVSLRHLTVGPALPLLASEAHSTPSAGLLAGQPAAIHLLFPCTAILGFGEAMSAGSDWRHRWMRPEIK